MRPFDDTFSTKNILRTGCRVIPAPSADSGGLLGEESIEELLVQTQVVAIKLGLIERAALQTIIVDCAVKARRWCTRPAAARHNADNGYLVPVADSDELATAMRWFIDVPHLVLEMGDRSRVIAEEKYDVRRVIAAMLRGMGIGS